MENKERFKKIFGGGFTQVFSIYVDTMTGVNYLAYKNGTATGITPLLDSDGKPVITKQEDREENEEI